MAGTVESLLRPLISKKNGNLELEEAGGGWANSNTGQGARLKWVGASFQVKVPMSYVVP